MCKMLHDFYSFTEQLPLTMATKLLNLPGGRRGALLQDSLPHLRGLPPVLSEDPRVSALVLLEPDPLPVLVGLDDRVRDVLRDVRRLASQPAPDLQSLSFLFEPRVPLPEEQFSLELFPPLGDVLAIPLRWWISVRSSLATFF